MESSFLHKRYPETILAAYPYGSRVYGTDHIGSDYDYIVIVEREGDVKDEYKTLVGSHEVNLNIFPKNYWQSELDRHYISALECIFLPDNKKIYERVEWPFKLDLAKLRHALSERASISFVKSKKKLIHGTSDFNPYIAKKSIWHALRILDYGNQIAANGRIVDYQASNMLLHEIMLGPDDWQYFMDKYKPMYNALKTQFREAAPKT